MRTHTQVEPVVARQRMDGGGGEDRLGRRRQGCGARSYTHAPSLRVRHSPAHGRPAQVVGASVGAALDHKLATLRLDRKLESLDQKLGTFKQKLRGLSRSQAP
jgi:hypothetical protein